MEAVVLIVHLIVCICLIGLVLLQRSEGGALGMGGGGSGALMSGRGAADALARMTSVAGGFFLVTSLGLTVLSGAASSSQGSSVFDNFVPSQSAPAATPAPATPAPAAPTTPDPTESSIAPETQLASATIPAPSAAPANTTRAAPLGPSSAAAATPAPRAPAVTPASTRTTTPPRNTAAATTVPTSTAPRTTPAPTTTRTASGTTPASTGADRPLVLPNTSGSGVSGISLSDDPATQPESIEIGNGVEAVRREQRAGPDQ